MTEDELVRQWLPFACNVASRDYFLPGGDRDDVRQEAAIALLSAIRSYDKETGTPFSAFLVMVVRRRMSTMIRLAHGLKHQALNSFTELNPETTAGSVDPAVLAEQRETLRRFAECPLTPLERRAVALTAVGATYEEVGGSTKSVDNALQRARKKLREAA